ASRVAAPPVSTRRRRANAPVPAFPGRSQPNREFAPIAPKEPRVFRHFSWHVAPLRSKRRAGAGVGVPQTTPQPTPEPTRWKPNSPHAARRPARLLPARDGVTARPRHETVHGLPHRRLRPDRRFT